MSLRKKPQPAMMTTKSGTQLQTDLAVYGVTLVVSEFVAIWLMSMVSWPTWFEMFSAVFIAWVIIITVAYSKAALKRGPVEVRRASQEHRQSPAWIDDEDDDRYFNPGSQHQRRADVDYYSDDTHDE